MSYRQRYLKRKKGPIHICKYCGKPMTTSNMTVDHIVPQNAFKKLNTTLVLLNLLIVPYSVWKMPELAVYTVGFFILTVLFMTLLTVYKHSTFNLVAACGKCNSSKSDRIDFRVVQGFIAMILFSKITFIFLAVIGLNYVVKNKELVLTTIENLIKLWR